MVDSAWKKWGRRVAATVAALSLGASAAVVASASADAAAAPAAVVGNWTDNFDGGAGARPNSQFWNLETGGSGWGNNERQYYTNSADNSKLDGNGNLVITARRDNAGGLNCFYGPCEVTSARLNSAGKISAKYGRVEARIKVPGQKGVWPAFWLLPADGSWPPELDVVEMRGQDPNTVNVAAHSNETGSRTTVGSAVGVPDTEGFHNYGLLWTEDELVWYFDDTEIFRAQTPSDMHKPMYMLVNLAVGGAAGTPADGLATPAEMQVDYIRAYELSNANIQADNARMDHVVHIYDWWH